MDDRLQFITLVFPSLLRKLSGSEKPQWGVMSPLQMVEHMSDSFRNASGKLILPVHTPAEQLPAFKSFMMSDKEFRPNTKNPLLGLQPEPARSQAMEEAIQELEQEIADFVSSFEKQPGKTVTNPIFGELNFGEWTQLLSKHARHHLRQFGLLA
jgi:hypothetical protein